jgi:hypothetical protein
MNICNNLIWFRHRLPLAWQKLSDPFNGSGVVIISAWIRNDR